MIWRVLFCLCLIQLYKGLPEPELVGRDRFVWNGGKRARSFELIVFNFILLIFF